MHNDLSLSLESLQNSIVAFNYITHIFLQQISKQSEEYAQRFMKFKKTKNRNMADFPQRDLSPHDEFANAAYEDSIKHRFNICYPKTLSFLQQYLSATFAIEAHTPKEIFNACLDKDIITSQEARNLLILSQDQEFITSLNEPGIDIYMVEYGACMHNILKRLDVIN